MPSRLLVLVIAVLPAVTIAQIATPDWDDTDAQIKAICRPVGQPRPPAADLPSPAQAKALKGCNSEKLYYGEGVKPDYRRARQCAFIEAKSNGFLGFYGDVVLMQIYANGLGVRRDTHLSIAYACRIESAPLEKVERISHLQSLKTKFDHFDYCDDITSGLAEGECVGRDSNQAAPARDRRLRALKAKLPPAARVLYETMKKSFDAFVDAHGEGEVDLSGTDRAAEEIAEQDSVREQLLKDLGRLISGQWPVTTAADAKTADTQLNTSYGKALAWAGGKDNVTTIKSDDVRKAQRLWLIYRNDYVRLAAVAAPKITENSILARLSRLRTAQLDQLSSD